MLNKLKGLLCVALAFMFGLKIDFGQFMYDRLGASYMLIGGVITIALMLAAVHYLFPYPKYIELDDEDAEDDFSQRNI